MLNVLALYKSVCGPFGTQRPDAGGGARKAAVLKAN